MTLETEIDILETALIAFAEGASDEKYAAIHSLERMLIAKKDQLVDNIIKGEENVS